MARLIIVPAGTELVHPYGSRMIHRIDPADRGATVFGAMTVCGGHKVARIDDVRMPGDYVPSKWDRWRNCPACFRD